MTEQSDRIRPGGKGLKIAKWVCGTLLVLILLEAAVIYQLVRDHPDCYPVHPDVFFQQSDLITVGMPAEHAISLISTPVSIERTENRVFLTMHPNKPGLHIRPQPLWIRLTLDASGSVTEIYRGDG